MSKGGDMPPYIRLVGTSTAENGEIALTFEVVRWRLVLHLAGEVVRRAREVGAPVWHPALWWSFARAVFDLWRAP